MDAAIPLQFRPTIIIFVGVPGEVTGNQGANVGGARQQRRKGNSAASSLKSVYEHFCDLAALEPVVQRGIGVLTIRENDTNATERTPGQAPGTPTPLDTLLDKVLHGVQGFRRVREIEGAGYPVYARHPQVYIVGCIDSKKVSEVAACVNELLGEERALVLLSYVLIDKPAAPGQRSTSSTRLSPPWMKDLSPRGDSFPLVNFCYIYQKKGQPLLYMEDQDIQYAAAEALFGFLATGISAAPVFTAATAPSLTITSADERIGSLGTSLIVFPRTHVESYCIGMHGAELANDWVKAIHLSRGEREALKQEVRDRAEEDAKQINDQLSDNAPRPGFAERPWPSLAFLPESLPKEQLREETARIFRALTEFKPQSTDQTNDEAKAAFCDWTDSVEKIWRRDVADALERRVSERVDEIGLHGVRGLAAARMYSELLAAALGNVHAHFGDLRKKHRQSYELPLQILKERGKGPWTPRREISDNRAGSTQGPPATAGNSTAPGRGATPPAVTTGDSVQAQQQGKPGSMPDREREIVENLRKRIEWLQVRVPTAATLVVVCAMATIPLIWLLLTLIPATWVSRPSLSGVVVAGSASLSAAGAWFYRNWSIRRARVALEDLSRAYCLYYAYQCEQQEDTLRTEVLEALIQRVNEVCLRITNLEEDLREIAEALRKSSENTAADLFGSTRSFRDVFVGNKEILSKNGYSLADMNQAIVDLRQAVQREEWHQTAGRIHEHLGPFLIEQDCSLTGITRDKLNEFIQQYARMIVAPYLDGELSDIAAALRSNGKAILKNALENAQVLYLPYHNIPELGYYICGTDGQRRALPEDALPPNTTLACTSSPDWLLLACFWTGGARTPWRADTASKKPLLPGLSKRSAWPER